MNRDARKEREPAGAHSKPAPESKHHYGRQKYRGAESFPQCALGPLVPLWEQASDLES